MRREALISLALLGAAATSLGLVFWVARGWPDFPACFDELTPLQERDADAFRRGYGPVHVAAGVLLAAAVWLLAAARLGRRRPGAYTLAGLAVALVLLAGPLFDRAALENNVLLVYLSIVVLPLTALVLVVSLALLLSRGTARLGAHLLLVVLWLTLAVLLPAHLAAVGLVDESFCITGLD